MTAADRIAEALLRLAARRWPVGVREEQAREWTAELHALRTEPGVGRGLRALGQVRFAFSLAAASPVEDEDGVPRGWREGLPAAGRALRPMATLVVFGVLAVGPVAGVLRAVSEWLLGLAGVRITWPAGTAVTVATALPALAVIAALAWWLGRREPVRWARLRRLGDAGPAAVAPAALAVAFAVLVVGTQGTSGLDPGALLVSLSAGAVAWTGLTATLAVTVVRLAAWRSRWWQAAVLAGIGTPLVVELAVTAAALPQALASGGGLRAALTWAPTLVSRDMWTADAGSWHQSPDAISLFNATNMFPAHLLLFTGLAVGYGLGAARPGPRRPGPLPGLAVVPLRLPPVAATAGVVAMLAGLLAWAYTLAVLTPAMPSVGETAPMPGGDGELYMWVAELRWAGVTLAALGLLLAAADRRAVALAAGVQTIALLAVDGILARASTAGPAGLRTTLAAAAVAAAVSWQLAGRRGGDPLAARRRLAWVAVTAACCGPILFCQGTPAVNHPFLPFGLAGATAVLAATFAVLAVHAAAATRQLPSTPARLTPARPAPARPAPPRLTTARPAPPRLTTARLTTATLAPAAVLGACGAATGAGVSYDVTAAALLLTAPMMLMIVAILRGPRAHHSRTGSVLWTTLVLASPALSALVVGAALVLSMFVANVLFAVAGSSWAADGLSLLPGAVLVAIIAGIAVARSVIRTTGSPAGDATPAGHPTDPYPDLDPAGPAPISAQPAGP